MNPIIHIILVKLYEEKMFMLDVYNKLNEAEEQLLEGKVIDGSDSLKSIRETVAGFCFQLVNQNQRNCISFV